LENISTINFQWEPYARLWRRFIARLVDDALLLALLVLIIGLWGHLLLGLRTLFQTHGHSLNEIQTLIRIGTYAIGLITGWFYYGFFLSSKLQATPGKLLLGIKVIDTRRNPLSFSKASIRYFATLISGLIFFISFIIFIAAAFTPKKQALHDLVAGTIVVKKG
jgi:uncharacterized RDD family membrane protein YckC